MAKNRVDIKKIEAMSKEEKLRLYDLIQQKKEIEKTKRNVFIPHEGQMPIALSKAKVRFVSAANGFGKTSYSVNELKWAMEGFNPIRNEYTKCPCTVVVVLDSPAKVKDVWTKELSKWYNLEKLQQNKNGHPYVTEWVWPNGSITKFMFHEQNDLAFESIEIDGGVIYDEIPSRNIFVALSRGQRTKGSKPFQLLIGTPTHAAWARVDLYEVWERGENSDLECFHGSTYQNEANLAEGYLESFTRLLSEDEKKVRLHGEFFDIGGLALAHLYKDSVHKVEAFTLPQDWPCIVAIDPHGSKKHHAVLLAIDPRNGKKFVVKELALKVLAEQFAVTLLEWSRGYRIIDWICDSAGQAEMTGGNGFKSFVQVLRDCGIRVRATTYEEKDDEQWIERIRSELAIPIETDNYGQLLPNLRIFAECQGLIKDIRNVAWLKYKNLAENKPKLDITSKDYLSCLKYALASAANIMPHGQQAKPIRLGGQNSAKSVSIRSRYMSRR